MGIARPGLLRGLGMVRHSGGEHGRCMGPIVDYPGYPPRPTETLAMRNDTGRCARGSVIQDNEPPRDPRGPRRLARRPVQGGGGKRDGHSRTICSQCGVRGSILAGTQLSGGMLVRKHFH